MRTINLTDTPEKIEHFIRHEAPEIDRAMMRARSHVLPYKREVYRYQGMVLYLLATQYNRADAHILELGTAFGYTAAIMAEAAPLAHIETLNPAVHEIPVAIKNLAHYANVKLVPCASWEYLPEYAGPKLDMIFIDGDHKRISHDLPWWEHIAPGGLMCFHDFSPLGSARQCPPVFEGVTAWAKDVVGKPLDVIVFDDNGVGFAGMYK